jgi:uncharacterized protein YdaU (DUF1376 family)
VTRLYWLPLHVPDFFADTGMLTAEERGALIYIMLAVWRSPDGWIDDDAANLARFTATGDRWRDVKKRIAPLLTFEGGRITHKTLQEEKLRAVEISERRKEASNARWRKNNGLDHASAHANAFQTQTQTQTQTENTVKRPSRSTRRGGPDK